MVNNNAAAVLLALNTLAEGREVIVSRGELVEIGGSLPHSRGDGQERRRAARGRHDQPHARGATTQRAIGERTALLLKVHPSNYRIVGFTAAVALDALVEHRPRSTACR